MKITGPWWAWLEGYWKIRTDPSKNGFSLSLLTAGKKNISSTFLPLTRTAIDTWTAKLDKLLFCHTCFRRLALHCNSGWAKAQVSSETKRLGWPIKGLSVDICCSKPGTASKVKSLEQTYYTLYYILYFVCLRLLGFRAGDQVRRPCEWNLLAFVLRSSMLRWLVIWTIDVEASHLWLITLSFAKWPFKQNT